MEKKSWLKRIWAELLIKSKASISVFFCQKLHFSKNRDHNVFLSWKQRLQTLWTDTLAKTRSNGGTSLVHCSYNMTIMPLKRKKKRSSISACSAYHSIPKIKTISIIQFIWVIPVCFCWRGRCWCFNCLTVRTFIARLTLFPFLCVVLFSFKFFICPIAPYYLFAFVSYSIPTQSIQCTSTLHRL